MKRFPIHIHRNFRYYSTAEARSRSSGVVSIKFEGAALRPNKPQSMKHGMEGLCERALALFTAHVKLDASKRLEQTREKRQAQARQQKFVEDIEESLRQGSCKVFCDVWNRDSSAVAHEEGLDTKLLKSIILRFSPMLPEDYLEGILLQSWRRDQWVLGEELDAIVPIIRQVFMLLKSRSAIVFSEIWEERSRLLYESRRLEEHRDLILAIRTSAGITLSPTLVNRDISATRKLLLASWGFRDWCDNDNDPLIKAAIEAGTRKARSFIVRKMEQSRQSSGIPKTVLASLFRSMDVKFLKYTSNGLANEESYRQWLTLALECRQFYRIAEVWSHLKMNRICPKYSSFPSLTLYFVNGRVFEDCLELVRLLQSQDSRQEVDLLDEGTRSEHAATLRSSALDRAVEGCIEIASLNNSEPQFNRIMAIFEDQIKTTSGDSYPFLSVLNLYGQFMKLLIRWGRLDELETHLERWTRMGGLQQPLSLFMFHSAVLSELKYLFRPSLLLELKLEKDSEKLVNSSTNPSSADITSPPPIIIQKVCKILSIPDDNELYNPGLDWEHLNARIFTRKSPVITALVSDNVLKEFRLPGMVFNLAKMILYNSGYCNIRSNVLAELMQWMLMLYPTQIPVWFPPFFQLMEERVRRSLKLNKELLAILKRHPDFVGWEEGPGYLQHIEKSIDLQYQNAYL